MEYYHIFSLYIPVFSPWFYLVHKPEHMQAVIEVRILLGFLANNTKICKNECVQDGRRLLFKNNRTIFKSNYSVRAML